jgi:hypothetical protein
MEAQNMARPEVTGRRPSAAVLLDEAKQHARAGPAELDAFSIEEFCRRHGISIAFFYKLRAQGLTPAELRIGSRVLITREAAAVWRETHTGIESTTN